MRADLAPLNRHAGHGRVVRIALLGGILLVALGARVFYAYGLPLSFDEVEHLRVAREISLRPGSFNLPLDSPVTSHALGVVYLTALFDWAGGGNMFLNNDYNGWYEQCLQCSYTIYLKAIYDNSRRAVEANN